MSTIKLPPLPQCARVEYQHSDGWSFATHRNGVAAESNRTLFTADQMQAYATQAVIKALAERQGEAVPFAWHVCSVNKDGSLSLEFAAVWEEAAHEHINDAIAEDEIEEAASWVVRPAYHHPPARQPLSQWIKTADQMPPSGQTVLVFYLNANGLPRRVRAQWIAAKSSESGSESDIGEYDEATDTYYDPEGWYEQIDNWDTYSAVGICGVEVTHWMPMPPEPAHGIGGEKP